MRHCLCDCASPAVETAIAQCTSRWLMARGHRLNTSIVLAAVHGLSGIFRTVSAVEPSLCRPLPTLSPSLIGHLAKDGPVDSHTAPELRVYVDDDELMLNVLRCQLTYQAQVVTNAEARFNKSLRPRKPEGSLGRTAQDGHRDSHTAPEL